MTRRIEDELRRLFEDGAEGFDMDGSLPRDVVRRARRRGVRTIAIVAAIAIAVSSAAVALRGGGSTAHTSATAQATRGATAHTEKTVMKLVAFAPADGQESPDDPSFEAAFQQHVQCMRDHGFVVPEPTKTDHGWSIIFAPGSDPLSDPAWREAALVTCSLEKFENRPLTGDLVMGFDAETIARFIACMQTQGYDLPEPQLGPDGEYRWPLEGLGIDTRTDEWNRAVFVACSPTQN